MGRVRLGHNMLFISQTLHYLSKAVCRNQSVITRLFLYFTTDTNTALPVEISLSESVCDNTTASLLHHVW